MRRSWILVAIAVTTLVFSAGCRRTVVDGTEAPREEQRIISQILTTDDPLDLEVRWFPSGCEEFNAAVLGETPEEVSIEILVIVDSGNCELTTGETSTMVRLAEPVDGRVVIDGNLGTTVVLDAEPQPPDPPDE